MNNAQLLIERLRKKMPTGTNYAIAKALEMDPSSLAAVMAGKYGLGNKAVIRLHELLQLDVRDLLVLIEEDKAKTPTDKEFWARRSPRITAASAITALALVTAGSMIPRNGYAVEINSSYSTTYTLCELFTKVLTFIKDLILRSKTAMPKHNGLFSPLCFA